MSDLNSSHTMLSRFEYDDTSTLTTFNLCETEVDKDYDEGVLSKFISKFKTAVSGQQSHQQQRLYRPSTNDEKYSLPPSAIADHDSYSSAPATAAAAVATTSTPTKPGVNDSYFPPLPPLPSGTAPPMNGGSGSDTLAVSMAGDKQQRPSTSSVDPSCIPGTVPLVKTSSCDSDNQSVMTNFSVSNSNSLSRIIARLRGEAPNKEYWMPDENCKECFECGAHFNFFRRKHHCRVCGKQHLTIR
jgi:hypothetical protein